MESREPEIVTESQTPDAYVWRVTGKPVEIQIDFDVVDRLESEIMRAFGSVPRRGLEIGGILLGTAEAGETLTAKIEDFELVLSKHEHGPSYVLAGEDMGRLEEALERWAPKPGRRTSVIGYFRSHTREGMGLSNEDLNLLAEYFPEETAVALILKPFATRVPMAGLFFREEGSIHHESSYQEFPFRRRELGDEGAEGVSSESTATSNGIAAMEAVLEEENNKGVFGLSPTDEDEERVETGGGQPGEPPSSTPPRSIRLRGGWVWLPLSFIFLLLGTVLGFQVALSVRSQIKTGPIQDPYALHLSATPSSDSVHVRWDRSAPAVQKAERGVLVITEDGNQKAVDLDIGHLRNGSVIYRRVSGDVGFRLEVFTDDKVSVAETIQFKTEAARK